MKRKQIKIEQKGDIIIIHKDDNFNHLISISYVFYERIMSVVNSEQAIHYKMSPRFAGLLNKIAIKNDIIHLSEDELSLFVDWIDTLCLIMLDLDNINYNHVEIKRYLTLSEKFIQKSKKILKKNNLSENE